MNPRGPPPPRRRESFLAASLFRRRHPANPSGDDPHRVCLGTGRDGKWRDRRTSLRTGWSHPTLETTQPPPPSGGGRGRRSKRRRSPSLVHRASRSPSPPPVPGIPPVLVAPRSEGVADWANRRNTRRWQVCFFGERIRKKQTAYQRLRSKFSSGGPRNWGVFGGFTFPEGW